MLVLLAFVIISVVIEGMNTVLDWVNKRIRDRIDRFKERVDEESAATEVFLNGVSEEDIHRIMMRVKKKNLSTSCDRKGCKVYNLDDYRDREK
jgi:predicted PurR-regulated permease PerM